MKIIIPGGSGQVGTMLARALHRQGHQVVVLTRRPVRAPWRTLYWDGLTLGPWVEVLDGADAVINLVGRSVNCRYNAANRREILESRVQSTRLIGQAIQHVPRPPHTWLQASTATIYAHRYDAPNDEMNGIVGGDMADGPASWRFSVDVAQAWEKALDEADTPQTRKVALRSAMIMSPDSGGVFATLSGLARSGLGGRAGDGRQYVSWIHEEDFVRAVIWLLEKRAFSGVVNLAAPNPLPQVEFMGALRRAWGAWFGLPAGRRLLELGAFFLRTETELILKSRRVIPGRLLEAGFSFNYPTWPAAASDLVHAWRYRSGRLGQTDIFIGTISYKAGNPGKC
ncbi:MAG: TIGR01777 family protein [Ardenticatenales bacterium]|nr:TIGR01777 family protein [Ardenticatenales bacterium]